MQPQKKKNAAFLDWQEVALQRLGAIQKKCKYNVCKPASPKLPQGMRRIKVQPKYVERTTVNSYIPMIILKGEWLRKTGFDCNSFVIVEQEQMD